MLPKDSVDQLLRNEFFHGVTPEEVARLDPAMFAIKNLEAGAVLIEQGSPPEEMYLILDGTLKVTKTAGDARNIDIIERSGGDFIGELALLENKARSSTVYCQTDVRVVAILREDFFSILERLPALYANLARTVAGRQRESDLRTTREVGRYDALFDLNQQIIKQKHELEKLNRELAEKNSELYRLATTDRLTGIYNRTYMMEMLTREHAESERQGSPLTCILMDIDHFKSFNDRHGHQVGDFVLAETARLVARTIRKGDTVCRYGGEEFLVALPQTSELDSMPRAEEIRQAIERAEYRIESLDLRVTVSLGIAESRPPQSETIDQLLKNADDALYSAKRNGRNRAVAHSQTATESTG